MNIQTAIKELEALYNAWYEALEDQRTTNPLLVVTEETAAAVYNAAAELKALTILNSIFKEEE